MTNAELDKVEFLRAWDYFQAQLNQATAANSDLVPYFQAQLTKLHEISPFIPTQEIEK